MTARYGFYRYSEGVAAGRYVSRQSDSSVKDDIMVGLYNEDGGCRWEFKIEEHHFRQPTLHSAIKLCIFAESVHALELTKVASLIRWMSREVPRKLHQVQAWLESNGFENMLKAKVKAS